MKEHLKQVFDERGRHYLMNTKTGERTQLASYTSWTFLDGFVGVSDFYTGTGEQIMSAAEFCELGGVKK